MKYLTPTQAAEVIGCNVRHIRVLCQKKKLKAKKRFNFSKTSYSWLILKTAAKDYASSPQPKGWERGKSRKK